PGRALSTFRLRDGASGNYPPALPRPRPPIASSHHSSSIECVPATGRRDEKTREDPAPGAPPDPRPSPARGCRAPPPGQEPWRSQGLPHPARLLPGHRISRKRRHLHHPFDRRWLGFPIPRAPGAFRPCRATSRIPPPSSRRRSNTGPRQFVPTRTPSHRHGPDLPKLPGLEAVIVREGLGAESTPGSRTFLVHPIGALETAV